MVAINGHRLPDALIAEMESPLWEARHDLSSLVKDDDFQVPEPFHLSSLRRIRAETNAMVDLAQSKHATTYGLVYHASAPSGYLDAAQAVMVSVTFSEEAICLDYSVNSAEPSVTMCLWSNSKGRFFWMEIAPTVEAFIEMLKARQSP